MKVVFLPALASLFVIQHGADAADEPSDESEPSVTDGVAILWVEDFEHTVVSYFADENLSDESNSFPSST